MLLATGGVIRLHTHIHADKKILEVQANTSAIRRGNLLIELIELEHTARLFLIVLDGPDVTRIEEQSHFHHPEQLGAVLQIHVKADVTALEEKVGEFVIAILAIITIYVIFGISADSADSAIIAASVFL